MSEGSKPKKNGSKKGEKEPTTTIEDTVALFPQSKNSMNSSKNATSQSL